MRKTKKTLAILAIVAMVVAMIPVQAFADTSAMPARLAGTTQYDTAVAIANQQYPNGSDTVVLAPGEKANLVDALAAGPLAAALNAPILLTDGKTLTADTKAILDKAKNVYVVSGNKVITDAVRSQLTGIVDVFGAEAPDTSVAIAKAIAAKKPFTKVVLANVGGQDALSVASFAAAADMPILVTNSKDGLPDSVKTYLASLSGVTSSYVIGGAAVISDAEMAQLPSATRIAGNTAYDTNLQVIEQLGSKFDNVFVANGETMVDALAGAPLAASKNAPIVLTDGTTAVAGSYVFSKMTSSSVITALGGGAVVPDSVVNNIAAPPGVTSVSAINSNIGIGGQTGFQFLDAKGTVISATGATYAVADTSFGTVDASGLFTGAKAGTATVNVTLDGKTYSATVNIYGTATSVTLSAPTSMVANNKSTQTITATVVDANGNTVSNFNGTAVFNYVNSSDVAVTPVGSQLVDPVLGTVVAGAGSAIANIVNGVATINLQSTNVPGVTDKLKVMNIVKQGTNSNVTVNGVAVTSSKVSVSTVAQTATSLTLSVPTAISNNQATTATLYAKVLDQAGVMMLAGSYPVTYTVSGPALVVSGSSSTTATAVFTGNGSTSSNSSATITITSQQGQAGTVSVQADSTGLTSATASFPAVAAGFPTALKLTVNKSSWVQGAAAYNTVGNVSVQVVDANGTPVGDTTLGGVGNGNITVNVKDADGNAATSLTVGTISGSVLTGVGSPDANGNITINFPDATGLVKLGIWDANAPAGNNGTADTYTVSISSTANNYNLAAQTATLTETASTIAGIAVNAPKVDQNILVSSSSYDVSFKLVDAYGNNVAQSGITVNLYPSSASGHTATLNGNSNLTLGTPLQLVTDTNGVVTATLAPQAYAGDTWVVYAQIPAQSGITGGPLPANPGLTSKNINVVVANPSSVSVAFNDVTTAQNSVASASAGDNMNIVLTAKDQYNNTVNPNTDTIEVTLPPSLSGNATIPTLGAGVATMKSGTTWKQYQTNIIRVPLAAGTVTIGTGGTLIAATAGAATVSVTDLSANSAITGSGTLVVNALTASTAAVFFNGAIASSNNKIAVNANNSVALVITPVDTQNNPGVATSTVTYNLSDAGQNGIFSMTQGGAPITQVTVPVNSAGVTVYYKASTDQTNAPISIGVAPVTIGLSGTVATVGAQTLTITTYGQSITGTRYVTLTGATTPAGGTAPTVPTLAATTFTNGVATISPTITNAAAQNLAVSVYADAGGITLIATSAALSVNPAAQVAVAPTLTTATVAGGAAVTIAAPGAGKTSWLAPNGTVAGGFVAGATKTTAVGTATSINAPANDGAYRLYTLDAYGNPSPASAGILTVDATAPTVVSAALTDATHLVVTFSEAVNAVAGDFTNGTITVNGAGGTAATFTVSAIAGSGTTTITLTVAGNAALVSGDTGTVDIAGTVTDLVGNALVPVAGQVVTGF